MSIDPTNHELLKAWKAGDQDAAATIFHRYQVRLMALVRSRFSKKLARRVDPEEIVLSAYRSFFFSAQNANYTTNDKDDLWPLLTTFALRKLARQIRRHGADRRSVNQEQIDTPNFVEDLISQEPTVEHAAMLSDEVEHLFGRLDLTAREVLVQTLQGKDVASIALGLGIHERSVRRALERIREFLPTDTLQPSTQISRSTSSRTATSRHIPPEIKLGPARYADYVLDKFIGAGAFSKVYRATDRSSGKTVAIKVSSQRMLAGSPCCRVTDPRVRNSSTPEASQRSRHSWLGNNARRCIVSGH